MVIVLNLSCPAVSQIYNLISFPFSFTYFVFLNYELCTWSTPIVVKVLLMYLFYENWSRMHDLPTPELPIKSTLIMISLNLNNKYYGCFISIFSLLFIIYYYYIDQILSALSTPCKNYYKEKLSVLDIWICRFCFFSKEIYVLSFLKPRIN